VENASRQVHESGHCGKGCPAEHLKKLISTTTEHLGVLDGGWRLNLSDFEQAGVDHRFEHWLEICRQMKIL
jgi:hypothetical protein